MASSDSRALRRAVARLARKTGVDPNFAMLAARDMIRQEMMGPVSNDLARRLVSNPPPSSGVEGQLCKCGCGKPLQRLPNGQLGVVTFSLGEGGERFHLPLR